ncbi:hypothetical protein [Thalassobacillus sp. CUG 92003]|uniref:hypothetical protein n=1 Tax=Thalassobacillus sp. CUG 92003 TaxID=2736641 RepID=UPI0015E66788|nr:hypothetical protein [Thalassobacillus sp. CUG 92003]
MENNATFANHHTSTPGHLWVVAIFFICLYAIGAYDYVMSLKVNAAYFSTQNYGEDHVAYFSDYPLIPLIFWTATIFIGLVAPLLLLFRLRWAVTAAFISGASQLCLVIITFGFMGRWDVFGPMLSLFDLLILLLTLCFFLYCRALSNRGVLR